MTSETTLKDVLILMTLIAIIAIAGSGLIVLPTSKENCEASAERRKLECIASGQAVAECHSQYELEKSNRCQANLRYW